MARKRVEPVVETEAPVEEPVVEEEEAQEGPRVGDAGEYLPNRYEVAPGLIREDF